MSACNEPEIKNDVQSFIDSIDTRREAEKRTDEIISNLYWDTVGVSEAPIKVVKSRFVKDGYSNYKDISLTFKNISDKTVNGVKFRWYGENAFGEPAEMGSYTQEGFGSGFMDKTLKPGRTLSLQWGLLSKDGKKIIKAWPTEVVFADGSKWKSSNK